MVAWKHSADLGDAPTHFFSKSCLDPSERSDHSAEPSRDGSRAEFTLLCTLQPELRWQEDATAVGRAPSNPSPGMIHFCMRCPVRFLPLVFFAPPTLDAASHPKRSPTNKYSPPASICSQVLRYF